MNGGQLTLYRVGEIAREGGDYYFTPVSALANSDVSFENLNDTELPQKLADLAVEHKLEAITAPIIDGKVVFTQLETGLYVVTQSEEDACDGFAAIQPFLISIPYWDGEKYVYDLIAKPKISPEPTPPTETPGPESSEPPGPESSEPPGPESSEPPGPESSEPPGPESSEPPGPESSEPPGPEPSEPPGPSLPQTGQMNWPIPVMAVGGIVFVVLGGFLCFRKKEMNEE